MRDYIVIIQNSLLTTFCFLRSRRMKNIFHILCNINRRAQWDEAVAACFYFFMRAHADDDEPRKEEFSSLFLRFHSIVGGRRNKLEAQFYIQGRRKKVFARSCGKISSSLARGGRIHKLNSFFFCARNVWFTLMLFLCTSLLGNTQSKLRRWKEGEEENDDSS